MVKILTADGRAASEYSQDFRVQLNAKIFIFHDLGIPVLHDLLNPLSKGLAYH